MNKMNFIRGMSVGLIVGSVVGMAVAPRRKKCCVSKALKSMGDVVENVADSIGL